MGATLKKKESELQKNFNKNIDDIMKSLGSLSDKYYSDISAIREADSHRSGMC